MEPNIANTLRKRRTVVEIKLLLREQQESNCTVKEFCIVRGMSQGTFFNWRKKYSADQPVNGDFISLQLNKTDASASLFAEIEYAGKTVIRLFRQVDPSYLKTLM